MRSSRAVFWTVAVVAFLVIGSAIGVAERRSGGLEYREQKAASCRSDQDIAWSWKQFDWVCVPEEAGASESPPEGMGDIWSDLDDAQRTFFLDQAGSITDEVDGTRPSDAEVSAVSDGLHCAPGVHNRPATPFVHGDSGYFFNSSWTDCSNMDVYA